MQDNEGLTPMEIGALRALLDRAAITEVLHDWGLARDTGRWDRLRACFAPGASIRTTWFEGSAEDFVERSIASVRNGARAQHFIGAASIALRGDRAIAETRMVLMVRGRLDGVEVEATCHGRFHDRFVRHDGAWRIAQRVPVYEKDRLDALEPGRALALDAQRLASQPEGYRHIAYLQGANGAHITSGLPTPGSEALAALEAQAHRWLHAPPEPAR